MTFVDLLSTREYIWYTDLIRIFYIFLFIYLHKIIIIITFSLLFRFKENAYWQKYNQK